MSRTFVRVVGVLCAGVIAATVVAMGAAANHVALSDRNDTRGPLDVQTVTLAGAGHPRWKVVTFGEWTNQKIWDYGFITINIDTFASPRADYFIVVGSVGTHLFGELWRDRVSARDYRVSGVKVWRAGADAASAKIPLRKMRIGERRLVYNWYVQTMFTGERCRRVCFDLVPDQGVVAEPLPVVTPTTSPTTSPTPSPTQSP